MLSGLIPSFISLFLNRNSLRVTLNSEFNTEFNHNTKTLFFFLINNYPEFEVKFVIADKKKRELLLHQYGDHFIGNSRFSDIYYILTSKYWFTSSLETPVGGVFHSFRRKVFHLGHGSPIKAIGLLEGYSNWLKKAYYRMVRTNFSFFISSSDLFDIAWSNFIGVGKEKVVRAGQPRNDNLTIKDEMNSSKKILYAPTWRPFSDTLLFPFIDFSPNDLSSFLSERALELHLRLHPNFESKLPDNIARLDNITILTKEKIDDINVVLNQYDILITDYSSIYVDYLLLDKPIVFIPYDFEEYRSKIGFSIDYCTLSPGPKPTTFKSLLREIDQYIKNENYYREERSIVNGLLNPIKSGHCQSVVDIM
ncbi:CDP-glycerol glycerophosphotransferase family protein [Grimontia hollisae]|nr:CDP-glycerol glycerophosphotransferase family protein [Grimontia hollisae]